MRVRDLVTTLAMCGVVGAIGWFAGRAMSGGNAPALAAAPPAIERVARADEELALWTARARRGCLESEWPTLGELCSLYASDRIAEIEPQLAGRSWSFSDRIDPTTVPHWHSVADEIEGAMLAIESADARFVAALDWGDGRMTSDVDFRAPEFNPNRVALAASDVADLHQLAQEHDGRILDLAEQCGILLEQALQSKWDAGAFTRVPFFQLAPRRPPGVHNWVNRTIVLHNWGVVLMLFEGDAPEYDVAARALERARLERAEAIVARIGALASR